MLLAGCYAAVCWANVVTRTQWLSDSRLYLAWAYRYLGYSEADAAHRTHNFLVNMDGVTPCGFCWVPGYEHSFFSGANGAVAGARPLYPLLSAPFVALFGPNGMLVVPVVAFAVSIVLVALLAHRLWGRHWGLLAGLLLLIPVTVSRYGLYAMTESLAVALTLACVVFLPLARVPRRRDLLWFTVALVAGLFVRQFAIALAAGVALAWLVVALRDRRLFNAWWRFAVAAVAATLLTLVGQSVITSHWFGGGALNLSARYQQLTCQALHHCGVRSIPWGIHYIAKADYHYIRTDLALVATVAVAILALWRWRSELVALTAGAAIATGALNLVVVWPSYYRYLVPIHPLILLTALSLIADFVARPRRAPSRSVDAPAEIGIGRSGPDVPRLGWVLAGVTFLGAVVVVWRRVRPPQHALVVLSFLLLAAAFLLIVLLVADRFGAGAGILAGITLSLSGLLLSTVLGSWHYAVLLAAGAGAVVLLPDGEPGRAGEPDHGRDGGAGVTGRFGAAVRALPPRLRLLALAGLAALATLALPVGAAIGGGAVAGWAASSVRARRVGNPWTLPAAATLLGTVVAGAVRVGVAGLSWTPRSLVPLIAADFRNLVPDRVLYLTCLVAVAGAVAAWRRPVAWYVAGAVAVTAVLHAGSPTPHVGDILAAYPALVVVAAGLLAPLGRPVPAAEPARQAVQSATGS
ncbi:hypothetical protein GCM10023322_15020 [Rugosimonospora acidiphila]|uniref:Glycosyltransferase RgtA/B/C/D-like domain-containing protein n=1 Tax=Rugosimonospora acidiphila TaxID=556531 RepID=A0ABP9RMB4_9ACTN